MYNSVSIRFGFSEIGFILQKLLLHGMAVRHINSTAGHASILHTSLSPVIGVSMADKLMKYR